MDKFVIKVINRHDKYNVQKILYFVHKNKRKFALNIDAAFIGNSFETIERVNKEIKDDKFYDIKHYRYEIVKLKDVNNE